MKIRKIKIKKYKVFDDIEFDFTDSTGKTLDNIVIAGINGSGKTTFLELILRLIYNQKPFEIIKEEEFKYYELEMELTKSEIFSYNYFISSNNYKERSISDFNKPFFVLNNNILKVYLEFVPEINHDTDSTVYEVLNSSLFDFQEFLKNVELNFKLCYFYDYSLKIDHFKSNILKTIDFENFDKNLEKYFEIIITKRLFKERNLTAAEIISSQIKRINNILEGIETLTKIVDIEDNKLIFQSINGKKLYLKDLSAGERQLFFRAIYLDSLELKDSIILVDEPELSLHPTWQAGVNKLYTNVGENCQTILTTHSPHIISSVNPENLFVLYFNIENKKLEVQNIAKIGKHSKGLEPNRIIDEIMGTPLRDFQTQKEIDYISDNLTEMFNNKEFIEKIINLTKQLGTQDPFIIRLNHQLLLLNRKKV